MGFFVFLIAASIASIVTENTGAGIIFGILSYILYKQGKRITALEKHRESPINPLPLSVSPEPATIPATKKPSQTISEPEVDTAPCPTEVNKSPVTPPPPKKSTREYLQGLFGASIAGFIIQGNPIARIGAVILFLGVGFALKLASEEGYFSPELRLFASALLSITLLISGLKLRHTRAQFAIILQGTGLGIFYITTFIAYKMYGLIPAPLAFVFFLSITVLSGILAIVENSRSIAVLAIIGGFLAPILASDGSGNHIALFSYITLLNLGIFAMCWLRSWRSLNLTGFLFTFFISATWAAGNYRPELYASCQFFLILFACMYVVINTLYTIKQPQDSRGAVDTLMTFGTPILYSLLQWNLVAPFEYGTAISSASFGAAHIIIARVLFARYGEKLRTLVESYLIIGLVLLTLAVPFTFDGRASSAIWALEAAALVWNGIRQKRFLTRALGIILLPLASILFLGNTVTHTTDIGFLNQYFLGIFLLTAGHLASGALLIMAPAGIIKSGEKLLGVVALWLAAFWWSCGGCYEIARHLDQWRDWCLAVFKSPVWVNWISFDPSIYSIFTSLSILGFWLIFNRFRLPGKKLLHKLLVPIQCWLLAEISATQFFNSYQQDTHILAIAGICAWPLFFIVHYGILYYEEKLTPKSCAPWQHRMGLWLMIFIVTAELCWIADRYASSGWRDAVLVLIPAFCTLFVSARLKKPEHWPFITNSALYCSALWLPVGWSMATSFVFDLISPSTAPLPYIPLMNALDIAQAAAVIALLTWITRMSNSGKFSQAKYGAVYTLLGWWFFVWATSTLLRIIHHTIGIPWNFERMFDSNIVQAAISIFWSILALTLMLLSHRKGWRQFWKIGAFLIGIVVVKLVMIDLSNHGTIGRIAAFIGVGMLMLGIGYFAPIPPEKKPDPKQENA